MNKIKIAFFGTSDRSISLLEALKNDDKCDLVLCITKKDTKVGRHQEIRETEVKKWAKANGVAYVTISNLKNSQLEDVIGQLKTSKVEYGVVADFSFIIPFSLIEFFENKLINIHFSLLPLYRGSSPVQFAILNGDVTTGITFMLVDRKFDSGDIIHQIGYKMSGKETAGELYNTLFELAAENLTYVLEQYHDKQLKPREQNEKQATYTLSPSHPTSTFIYKEDAQIKWQSDAKNIERSVRAYNPWPIAWTTLEGLENNKQLWLPKLKIKPNIDKKSRVKIFEASVTETNKIEIKQLQLEGRNKVDWKTFENGYITQ